MHHYCFCPIVDVLMIEKTLKIQVANSTGWGLNWSPTSVANRAWTHVTITRDHSTIDVYLNATFTAAVNYSDWIDSTQPLFIGCSAYETEHFHGIMDEVY
eukprot:UN27777